MSDWKPADLKFVADINLGTLARWLMILGYDTSFERERVNRAFLRRAQQEGRIVLTRKRDMANRQFIGRLVVIEEDHVRRQLGELMEKIDLPLDLKKLYNRCVHCNALLTDIPENDVEGLVPEYVYHQSGPFRKCPDCGKVYWSGTHEKMTLDFLRQHTLVRLP